MGTRGPRSGWRRAALLGTIAVLGMLPGSAAEGDRWGERAVLWTEARDRASHRSVADLLIFESPETVHHLCCNQIPPVQGREALADFVAGMFGDTVDEETMNRTYLDVSGVVVEYRWPTSPFVYRPDDGGPPIPPDELQVSEIMDGEATRTIHAVALPYLQAPVPDGRTFYGDDLGAAQKLADRYLSAWSGGDRVAVGELYAGDATVVDSLLGVRVTGRDAIGAYAAERGGVRLQQDSLGTGQALYGYWAGHQSHLTAYLTYTGDDGDGCPGDVTAALQIVQGQIVAERRYHEVTSTRRCIDDADLPDGWWTHAVIPAPMRDRITGIVTAAGQRIEMHNGTPGSDDLVRWAMARFPAADLTSPAVSTVAFGEEAHQAQCAEGRWGLSLQDGLNGNIFLCYTVGTVATPLERAMILHELAHVWMWQNVDELRQEQFIAWMHLPTWESAETPWDQRGVEHAASVIAWGLGDEDRKNHAIANRSCAELMEAFELLTGAAPLQPPCPPEE